MVDLIDRNELRKGMYREAFEKDSDEQRWDGGCWIRYKMFERVVDSIPSVQPERKKGKWFNDRGMYRCTACNEMWVKWWAAYMEPARMYKEMKYCPNCGAKMEED